MDWLLDCCEGDGVVVSGVKSKGKVVKFKQIRVKDIVELVQQRDYKSVQIIGIQLSDDDLEVLKQVGESWVRKICLNICGLSFSIAMQDFISNFEMLDLLQHLDLTENKLDDKIGDTICSFIENSSSLSRLILDSNNFIETDFGLSLQQSQSIEEFSISYNPLVFEIVYSLLDCLTINMQLKQLNMLGIQFQGKAPLKDNCQQSCNDSLVQKLAQVLKYSYLEQIGIDISFDTQYYCELVECLTYNNKTLTNIVSINFDIKKMHELKRCLQANKWINSKSMNKEIPESIQQIVKIKLNQQKQQKDESIDQTEEIQKMQQQFNEAFQRIDERFNNLDIQIQKLCQKVMTVSQDVEYLQSKQRKQIKKSEDHLLNKILEQQQQIRDLQVQVDMLDVEQRDQSTQRLNNLNKEIKLLKDQQEPPQILEDFRIQQQQIEMIKSKVIQLQQLKIAQQPDERIISIEKKLSRAMVKIRKLSPNKILEKLKPEINNEFNQQIRMLQVLTEEINEKLNSTPLTVSQLETRRQLSPRPVKTPEPQYHLAQRIAKINGFKISQKSLETSLISPKFTPIKDDAEMRPTTPSNVSICSIAKKSLEPSQELKELLIRKGFNINKL